MGGGMEDAHEQDRQARFDAEQRNSSNDTNSDASVENSPKGQISEIDFQQNEPFDYGVPASDDEEDIESSQPPIAPSGQSNQTTQQITNASPSAAPEVTAQPTQGIDLGSLFAMLKKELQDQVDVISKNIEKKELAHEIKRAADMAKIQALAKQIQEKRTNAPPPPLKVPPPLNDVHIQVSTSTPSPRSTFASVTSTNTLTTNQNIASPTIPALSSTPSRQDNSDHVTNPYLKPSPNFKSTGTGKHATIVRSVPSSVKYRQLAPIEYEPEIGDYI
jgi:hypothetical protein